MKPIAKNGKFLGYADDKQVARLGLNGGKPKKGYSIFDAEKAEKEVAAKKAADAKKAAEEEAKKAAADAKKGANPAQVKKAPSKS